MQLMSPRSILNTMTDGAMVEQASGFTPNEKVLIAEYLAGASIAEVHGNLNVQCTMDDAKFDYTQTPPWSGWGLDPQNRHSIAAEHAQLARSNISKLELKWVFAFPEATRVRSQPAFGGGKMFIGGHDGHVYAIDRKSGCVAWKFKASAEVRTGIVISPWASNDRSTEPTLYFGDFLGDVYSVNAVDGSLNWRRSADDHPSATLTSAPVLFEDKLIVPVSSLEVLSASNPEFSCCTFRGSILALDAATGETLWRTYTVDDAARRTYENTGGVTQQGPSGAPVWSTPAVDAKRRSMYFGTGENYSTPATDTSDAIFSLSVDDGSVNWVYQALSNDAFNTSCLVPDRINCPTENGPDYDFGAAVILSENQNRRDLVLAGQKSGIAYAIDAATGELQWSKKVGRGGVVGGIHFGMAADGERLFVPIADTPDGKEYNEAPRPGIYALSIASGEELWAAPMADRCGGKQACFPGISAAITVIDDLVLAGGIDGILRVYDSRSGDEIWSYDTARTFQTLSGAEARGGGMSGGFAPIVYEGILYVGSGYAFAGPAPGNVLLAFEVAE
jgi:polyvinyl alcohol dehydrogenase (cytochrome)